MKISDCSPSLWPRRSQTTRHAFLRVGASYSGCVPENVDSAMRRLEHDGIVQRTIHPQMPPKVEYQLTTLGAALRPTLRALLDWANFRKTLTGDQSS